MKIIVLGQNREAMQCCIIPDEFIGCSGHPNDLKVRRPRKIRFEESDEPE
ncbi:MAG: hypothetical protein WC824_06545 [Bacteroidota bacterium]